MLGSVVDCILQEIAINFDEVQQMKVWSTTSSVTLSLKKKKIENQRTGHV